MLTKRERTKLAKQARRLAMQCVDNDVVLRAWPRCAMALAFERAGIAVIDWPAMLDVIWIVVQHPGGNRKRCSIASLYFNGDAEEANARLIASAPALADALQALVARLDGHTAERFLPLVEDARTALRAAGRLADEASGTAPKAPSDPTPGPKASP